MDTETIADALREYIQTRRRYVLGNEIHDAPRCATFAEIQSLFVDLGVDFLGPIIPHHPVFHNLVLWHGINRTAWDVFKKLGGSGEFIIIGCGDNWWSLYDANLAVDFGLPIAHEVRDYSEPHWLPSVIVKRATA